MKILYVSQFFKPERVAAAFRSYDNAKIWTSQGENVTVFTAYPNFPTGKIFDGYKTDLLSEEVIDGIRVIRSKIIIKENTSKLKRGLSALSFLIFGLYNIIFNRKKIGKDYDIVLGTSGTIFTPILAYFFSKVNKIPFVIELRDITYKQMQAVYNDNKNLPYIFIRWLELKLCQKANKVVVVTNGFKKQLILDGIEGDKIEVNTNGVFINETSEKSGIIKTSKKNEFTLTYIGNIGESQNLNQVLTFFESIEIYNRQKKLILIGDGAKKQDFKRYINENAIDNVIIMDGMEQEELDSYYSITDFCIVSLKNNDFFRYTIPSKIFQIMLKKTPILYFGPEGESANIIRESRSGIVYTDKDYMALARTFSNEINEKILCEDFDLYKKQFEESGYNYVKSNYDRQILSLSYLKILKEQADGFLCN